MKKKIVGALATIFSLGITTAAAQEMSFSGFGTLGYAQSNQSYDYERFVNSDGTFKRDSIAGVQADIKFTDQIGATVQAKIAPSISSDSVWDGTLSWAFLSWRPANDWLIRLGKQRVSLYLYSESTDVGVTYDFAHLPDEMYSLAPTTDYVGASISKTWSPKLGDLTLDGYAGNIGTVYRSYQRDNIFDFPTQQGANFEHLNVDSVGLALTLQQEEDKYRFSIQKQTSSISNIVPGYLSLEPATYYGLPADVASGAAYTVLPQAQVTSLDSLVYTFGGEIYLPRDFRLIGEYARRVVNNVVTGLDTNSGYVALLKDVDNWTYYVSCAAIKSKSNALNAYQAANNNTNGLTVAIPPAVPGYAQIAGATGAINATQRGLADALQVYDQYTIALGTSYRLSPKQKIKVEWARTHVGVASSFLDVPSGGNAGNHDINVMSISYNFAF